METDKYHSAIVKIEEIVEFVNKLGLTKIDKSVIETTDSDTIIELFSSILEKLNIIKKDKLKLRFDGMQIFSYTGLHDRSIYIFKLFNSIKYFIKETLKIDDFNVNDLLAPVPKRTKKILTKILKFYKFKQDEKEIYKSLKEELEISISAYKDNLIKNEKSLKNFNQLKNEREDDNQLIDTLGFELEENNGKKDQLNIEILDLQENLANKTSLLSDIEEKIKHIDLLNEKTINKINNLKGLIVHSPETTQNLLEEYKDKIEKIKLNNYELENILKMHEKDYTNLLQFSKLVNEYESSILELDKLNSKMSLLSSTIHDIYDNKVKKEKTISEKKSQIDNLNKSIKNIDEYLEEFVLKQKKNIELKDDKINIEKEKYQDSQKRIQELNKLLKEQNDKNTDTQNNIFSLDQIESEFTSYIENEMNTLLGIVMDYSSKLSKLLENMK